MHCIVGLPCYFHCFILYDTAYIHIIIRSGVYQEGREICIPQVSEFSLLYAFMNNKTLLQMIILCIIIHSVSRLQQADKFVLLFFYAVPPSPIYSEIGAIAYACSTRMVFKCVLGCLSSLVKPNRMWPTL